MAVQKRLACIIAAMLLLGATVTVPRAVGFQVLRDTSFAEHYGYGGVIPQSDRDAERWLKRAEQAAARGDWKLAADTLTRMIEHSGHQTVSLDGGIHFYSALRCAQQQIASWPPEGIAIYRLLHDGEVQRRFEEARQTHDFDALRTIARRFPMTTPGPDAIHLLANRLIDRYQAREAIDLLEELAALPHSQVPRWQILHKLAIAHAASGQYDLAADTLEAMRQLDVTSDQPLPVDWAKRIQTTTRFVDTLRSHAIGQGLDLEPISEPWHRRLAGVASRARRPCHKRLWDRSLASTSGQQGHRVSAWPQLLGPPAATGRMPAFEPPATATGVLHEPLPGVDRMNLPLIRDIMDRTGRPPVWQAVSDGRRLFVTCPSGLIARDLTTFDFLWQAVGKIRPRDPRIVKHRFETGFWEVDNSDKLDALSTQALFQEYRGVVSTAFGLVFIIEQAGTPGEQYPTHQGIVPLNEVVQVGAHRVTNSLRTFEADTGRAVWTRGRGGPVDDELKDAHFYAAPVVAGSHLIVPYLQDEDFLLAVLKPGGTLVKRIQIGRCTMGILPMNAVLQPTACGGTIYVQTGAELFIALSASDYSLRWLTRYERAEVLSLAGRRRREPGRPTQTVLAQADEWLATPPLVAGRLVLLAAHDCDSLVAFDRHSGIQKWSFPRSDHRYLVGADEKRVILAGANVSAVRLETGQREWTYDRASPMGRPAICGTRVLVSTREGLLSLDIETGRQVGELLLSEKPLGNLLVIDGALYSLSANEIAKLSDVDKSRTIAVERLKENPQDPEALLRLAWLASLEKDWDGTLSWLNKADQRRHSLATEVPRYAASTASDSSGETERRIAHLHVAVLLNLAAEVPVDERGELLERAASSALRTTDKIKAGLALCGFLAEQHEETKALRLLLDLLRDIGNESVSLEPNLHVRSDLLIADRLLGLWAHATSAQRTDTTSHVRAMIDAELEANRTDLLVRLADVLGFAPQGAHLDLHLGEQALADGDPETATFYLSRAADRVPGTDLATEATGRLATTYARPGEGRPNAPERQCRLPHVLRDRGTLQLTYEEKNKSVGRLDTLTFYDPNQGEDVYAEIVPVSISEQLKGLKLNDGEIAGTRVSGDRHDWIVEFDSARPGRPVPPDASPNLDAQPAVIAGPVAVLSIPGPRGGYAGRQLRAIGLTSGREMWPPLTVDPSRGSLPDPPMLAIGGIVVAAVDGQTLVAIRARKNAESLWRRQFPGRRLGTLADVGGELVVIDADAVELFVFDTGSGRLRRQFQLMGGGRSSEASDKDGVGAYPPAQRAGLSQAGLLAGGSFVGDAKTEGSGVKVELEPQMADAGAHVAIVGDVVCRSGYKHVFGRNIADGHIRWNLERNGLIKEVRALSGSVKRINSRGAPPLPVVGDRANSGTGTAVSTVKATGETPVPQLCHGLLGARHVGVCYRGNQYAVVNAQTGVVVTDIIMDDLLMPPLDATLDRARLLIFGITDEDPPEHMLTSFPLDPSSGSKWKRRLGFFASINRRMMRASPDYVAVVQYLVESSSASPVDDQTSREVRLHMPSEFTHALLLIFDKATGDRLISRPYEFDEHLAAARPTHANAITDVLLFDHQIIAVAPKGYYVLKRGNPPRHGIVITPETREDETTSPEEDDEG